MEPIIIYGTRIIPKVNFDAEKGLIEISGKSVPSDSISFYKPLLEWVGEYSKSPKEVTTVNFCFEYFNTNTSKTLLDLMRRLELLYVEGHKVVLNWYYDDEYEDMYEAGEDYDSLIKIPFNLIKIIPL